jgi:chorismate-pyruvate lyase
MNTAGGCAALLACRRQVAPMGLVAIVVVLVCAIVHAQRAPDWPDTFDGRLEALALIQTLNAGILGSPSATAVLERWCADHHLAEPPVIVAARVKTISRPATPEQQTRLQVSAADAVAFRHVRLRCGDRVLSEADNWYVPGRLTAEMNRLLETTDTPFGRVVRPLEPYRQTFAATLLWSPLPSGWETGASALPVFTRGALAIPDALFEHHALLYTSRHTPFAEVDEVYRREILAFQPSR